MFSATLREADWPNSRIVADDPAAEVRRLRKQQGGDIIVMASASVIRNLLAAGELDRLSITLCPALAGGGARLFGDDLPGSAWSLAEATVTDSGAICLLYERKPPAWRRQITSSRRRREPGVAGPRQAARPASTSGDPGAQDCGAQQDAP